MAGSVDSIDVGTLAHALDAGAPSELANAVLLDVREPWEFATARIGRSVNIPMSTLVAPHRRSPRVAALSRHAACADLSSRHTQHAMRSLSREPGR